MFFKIIVICICKSERWKFYLISRCVRVAVWFHFVPSLPPMEYAYPSTDICTHMHIHTHAQKRAHSHNSYNDLRWNICFNHCYQLIGLFAICNNYPCNNATAYFINKSSVCLCACVRLHVNASAIDSWNCKTLST